MAEAVDATAEAEAEIAAATVAAAAVAAVDEAATKSLKIGSKADASAGLRNSGQCSAAALE